MKKKIISKKPLKKAIPTGTQIKMNFKVIREENIIQRDFLTRIFVLCLAFLLTMFIWLCNMQQQEIIKFEQSQVKYDQSQYELDKTIFKLLQK